MFRTYAAARSTYGTADPVSRSREIRRRALAYGMGEPPASLTTSLRLGRQAPCATYRWMTLFGPGSIGRRVIVGYDGERICVSQDATTPSRAEARA